MPAPTRSSAKSAAKPTTRSATRSAPKPATTSSADPAQPLLKLQTPHARALTEQLRALIKQLVPASTETVHLGWEVITFGSAGRMTDAFASLAHRPTYVNIQFVDGVDLPDPHHRLEGTGKRMRHVKLYTAAEARSPDVKALIKAAAKKRGL